MSRTGLGRLLRADGVEPAVGGSWVLLPDGQISLRSTRVDVDAVCAEVVQRSAYPRAAAWVDGYVRGRNSDVDALTAFGPRDGPTA